MVHPRTPTSGHQIPAGDSPARPGADAAAPAWDLSTLYSGPDDPRLEADLAEAAARAEEFGSQWRGTVAPGTLSAAELGAALDQWEGIEVLGRKPTFYASLRFAADTQNETAQALLERTRERWAAIEAGLVFFTIELTQMPDESYERLVASPELTDARHYLAHVRRRRPHTLSEPAEQVITKKNLAGRNAFQRLFEKLIASFSFVLTIDGETKTLSGEEVLALLSHPDRDLRERAYGEYLVRFEEHGLVLTEVFNSLLLDHRLECDLRHYSDLAEPTHRDNEVTAENVEALMTATERHYHLARRYFRLKAELLGLDRLKQTDIYAPLAKEEREIPFDRARRMTLDAFRGFSPTFANLATEFFEKEWIDGVARPGKAAGASCMSYAPSTNPFILATYTGTMRDLATLAHELGHGIHDRLASRQRYLNFDPPLTLAETASVFAEMILTRHMLGSAAMTVDQRRGMLSMTIDEIMATVFRQNVLTRFELSAHEARRDGPLSSDQLGDLWWRANAQLYGDTVEMIPAYHWGWSYIPHFVHSRFYCYAYVFGELVALTLYRRYLEEGPDFLPQYVALLEAGGSQSPADLLGPMGLDISDPSVWNRGFLAIEELISELETLGRREEGTR